MVPVEAGGIESDVAIEAGAPGAIAAPPVELVKRVRFFDGKVAGAQDNELPETLVTQQTAALENVRQVLKENGWIVEAKAETSAHYQVAVGSKGEYEINIGSPIQTSSSLLLIDDSAAPQKVVERLIHLAKYQAVQSLSNEDIQARLTARYRTSERR